jgi:hypothetical protein
MGQVAFPNFFAVGPARTASTWLHNALAPHAHLPLTVKETRFFDLLYRRGWRWYCAQFGSQREEGCFGEVAPTYFHSNLVRMRIKQSVPGALIICTLRDPVERLYSLFRYLRFRGSISWTFEYALTQSEEMIESARYGHYIRAWIEDFGPANVFVTIYDDIERDPQTYVDSICDFISIPRFALLPSLRERVNTSDDLRAPTNYPLLRISRGMARIVWALRLDGAFKVARRIKLKRLFFGRGRELPPAESADGGGAAHTPDAGNRRSRAHHRTRFVSLEGVTFATGLDRSDFLKPLCSQSCGMPRETRKGAGWAEGVGFEPTSDVSRCRFSRPVPSTARPPLQALFFKHLWHQWSGRKRSTSSGAGHAIVGLEPAVPA